MPAMLAAMTTFCSMATALSPVMASSLPTMMATTHAGTLSSPTSIMSTVIIRSLSARGSKNFPSTVTERIRLARYPSSQSVRHATRNSKAAAMLKIRLVSKRRITIRIGDTDILRSESAFGRFLQAVLSGGCSLFIARYLEACLYFLWYLKTLATNSRVSLYGGIVPCLLTFDSPAL